MPKSRRRSYFLVPSFIVLCSIVAGVIGSRGRFRRFAGRTTPIRA